MSSDLGALFPDAATLQRRLGDGGYLADRGLATALFCAVRLPQALLLEGEPGVGKTEAAKALAEALDTRFIRLQCYEGIDAAEALYEWNYPRQLLTIRLAEARGAPLEDADLFTRDYLVERPLLAAIEHDGPRPAVLLVDEVDRSDDEFEAFLFEVLAEGSVTIPELGTLHAARPPIVILTSNRTRDLHDALKRRCLYHWIDYPSQERATAIVRRRVPEASVGLAEQATAAVSRLRSLELQKPPGVAEAINWVAAARLLGLSTLDEPALEQTLGSVLKYREDLELARERSLLGGGPVVSGPGPVSPDLAAVVSAFGRLLHEAGVPVTPERIARFAKAVTLAPPVAEEELYWAGRVTLLTARQQIPLYDAVFQLAFRGRYRTGGSPAAPRRTSLDLDLDLGGRGEGPSVAVEESDTADPVHDPVGAEPGVGGAPGSGSSNVLRHKSFADCTPEELATLRALVAQLQVAPPSRPARRDRRHRRGRRLDLRATLRRSQRTAGDPVDRVTRRPKSRPRRLVLIADVSGSMEPYSRTFLHLLHSAVRAARAETFVFSTRLTRVTRALGDTDPDAALARASREFTDWSGGTLIGRALADFNNRWGRRGMARGAVVVIVSDGCDFGDHLVVAREMQRLSRLAHRILWVNPRAARVGYEPRFRGMIAALPYVDALLSGHSLEAMAELVDAVRSEGRPGRGLLDALGPLPREAVPSPRGVVSYLLGAPGGG